MIRVGVIGASGYGGAELLRLLSRHPDVKITYLTSNEYAGQSVASAHPNLLRIVNEHFTSTPTAETCRHLPDADAVFLALPHGVGSQLAPALSQQSRIIDLSGDHRLVNELTHSRYYPDVKRSQTFAESCSYGLPELFRGRIVESRHVSSPGCFATAVILGLAPLALHGIRPDFVVVDAKTGSSGSGAKSGPGTHHPDRSESFYSYKPFAHQHLPEIAQALDQIAGNHFTCPGSPSSGWEESLLFQTHSAPFVRGIFASIYFELPQGSIFLKERQLRDLYSEFYRNAPFIRMVDGSPNIKWVSYSNFADIGISQCGSRVAVFVALDNLVKGAAGQAIQNFNLMFHLNEVEGLSGAAGHP